MARTKNVSSSDSSSDQEELTATQAQMKRLRKSISGSSKKQKKDNHACTMDSDMKWKVDDISRNVASLSVLLEKMNKKIGLIMDVMEKRGGVHAGRPKNKRAVAKSTYESNVEERMKKKRSNPEWIKETSKFTVSGISDERMKKIREVLISGPDSPSGTAIKISKCIWDKSYIENYLVGPQTRAPRGNERQDFLPPEEELKLKECLEQLTCKFLNDHEWRNLVRDPINQATRDTRGWLQVDIDIDESLDNSSVGEVPGTSGLGEK